MFLHFLLVTSRAIFKMGIVSPTEGLYYLGHTVSNPNKIIVTKQPDFFEFFDDEMDVNGIRETIIKEEMAKSNGGSKEKGDLDNKRLKKNEDIGKLRGLQRDGKSTDPKKPKEKENNDKKTPKRKDDMIKSSGSQKEKEGSNRNKLTEREASPFSPKINTSLEDKKRPSGNQLENTYLESKLNEIRKNPKDLKLLIKYLPDYNNRIYQLGTNYLSNETQNLINGKDGLKLLSFATETSNITDIESKIFNEYKNKEDYKDTSDKINDLDKKPENNNPKELKIEFPILEDVRQISSNMQFSLLPKDQYFRLMNNNGKCLARVDLDLYFTTCDKAVQIDISSGIEILPETPQLRNDYRDGMNKTKNELMEDIKLNDVKKEELLEKRAKIVEREKQIHESGDPSNPPDPGLKDTSDRKLAEMRMLLDQEISANERRTFGLQARMALADKIENAEIKETK